MSAVFTFTTPAFVVSAASAIDANTVRVTMSAPPNAFLPANFSIPTTTIVAALPDPGDPNSVILALSPGLQPANYVVTCSGLFSGSPGVAMTAPFTAAFQVLVGPSVIVAPNTADPVVDQTALTTLRSHIPPSMKGDVWTQLLATLGEEEQDAWQQAKNAYDQLFLVSADGKYLDQRASEEGGYQRPELVGFSDDVFRDLVIQLSTRKLTLNAFLKVLEVYYGIDSVRAWTRTTTPEPFNIPDASAQAFIVDGVGPFTVTFKAENFTSPSSVTAIEAAVALNEQFRVVGAKALALPYLDTQTGLTYLSVYTASRGLRGSIESISGPLPFSTGRKTVQTQARSAYVRITGAAVEVVLPATSIVVSRIPDTDSANVQEHPSVGIVSAEFFGFYGGPVGAPWGSDSFWGESTPWGGVLGNTVLVTTNAPHGLSVGSETFVDGLQAPTTAGSAFAPNGLFTVIQVPAANQFIIAFE